MPGTADSSAPKLTVVVCGSFRRDPAGLRADLAALQTAGCDVLSPRSVEWVGETEGFVFAAHERDVDPRDLETAHLEAMRRADLVWMHLPERYLGLSAAYELGWARAHGLPVFARCDVAEPGLQGQIVVVDEPARAVAQVSARRAC